ncbi:MAG: DUF411 domain-containing protein [Minisyncoccia bacterium]
MGYMEPQDQPGDCFECGMKLLEMQTMQTKRRLVRQYEDQTDLTQTTRNNISAKSASSSAKSAYLYFIEGHIPIEAINKLLTEKLEIDGITLPEMSSGSPGMPRFKIEKWKIHSIKNAQDQGIFMEI